MKKLIKRLELALPLESELGLELDLVSTSIMGQQESKFKNGIDALPNTPTAVAPSPSPGLDNLTNLSKPPTPKTPSILDQSASTKEKEKEEKKEEKKEKGILAPVPEQGRSPLSFSTGAPSSDLVAASGLEDKKDDGKARTGGTVFPARAVRRAGKAFHSFPRFLIHPSSSSS